MKIFNRCNLIFLLICVQVSMLYAQSISTSYPQVKSKIDPILQQAIIQKERYPDRPMSSIESHVAGTRLSAAYGDVVAVLIESDDDINKYTSSIDGIRIGSRHGNIYTAFVPLRSVAQLVQLSTVRYIEASRRLYPSLDLSRPKTGADVLQALPDSTKRLTGKGVIIGFTDSGINTDHPNFKLPDGRTRILYVWDQYGSGTPPSGFTYGVEKDSSAINARTWSMSDFFEHGTHVSGIAAGNGRPSMQYIGMAPEADIIMVSNQGDDLWNHGLTTVGTLDGYDYIRAKANTLHKRFVINTSQGTNLGPHDGTTLFEQAVNADVAAGDIHCISAGNEATSARHASAVVTTSSPEVIQCSLGEGLGAEIPMDIWYETNDRLVLRIKESTDPSYVSLFPPVDSTITYSLSSVDVTVTTRIGSPLNGDNEIYITFYPKTSSCNLDLQFFAQPGNTLPDGGRIDLWWERNYSVNFTTNIDQFITLGMPACADSAITIASYNNRDGYGSVDDISTFSARGPRRDGVMKPEIAGIGGMVTSSVGSGSYATFSGTSMSSPHVAGAVALLLQQDSTLTNYQIRQKLFAAATADGFTGTVPNPTWGYGKLNVFKAAGYNGVPIISISKDTIYFNNAFIDVKSNDSLTIENFGNENLTIDNISVSNPIFSVNRTSFIIPPRSREKLVVSVTPTSIGSFSGSVSITCNDSINPTLVITVLGYSDYPPSASVTPDSLSFTLKEQDSTSAIITISNSGAGALYWEYEASGLFSNKMQVMPYLELFSAGSKWEKWTGNKASFQSNLRRSKYYDRKADLKQLSNYGGTSNAVSFPLFGTNYRGVNQIEPTTGAILRAFLMPLSDGPDGLAYDDTYLYVLDGNSLLIYKIDAQTGDIVDTFTSLPSTSVDGLATDGKLLYLQDYNNSTIYAIDIETKVVVGMLQTTVPIGGGITYAGRRKTLFASNFDTGIYELDISTGAAVGYFPSPDNAVILGVAYSNSADVLIVSGTNHQVYLLDPNTGAVLSSFAGHYSGLAADESHCSSPFALQPNSGNVPPGGSQEITVKVNARNTAPGSYHSVIGLKTNDPLHNPLNVPVSLRVIGTPVIRVIPDTLNYGLAYLDITRKDTLHIENVGSEILQVNNVIVSDTAFHLNKTSFSVESRGQENIIITYTPSSLGAFAATVSISSNDSSALLKTVPIYGEAVQPPILTVAPDSFAVTLASGDSTTRTMTITNTGLGILNWSVPSQLDGESFEYIKYVEKLQTLPVIMKAKGESDAQEGPPALSIGGPDSAGYRWIDSDQPGGPTFNWTDIKAAGTMIPISGDDVNAGPIPIGFDFNFYGNLFNTFRICTNGWISFSSNFADYYNYPLPDTLAPRNMIAAFWDDLYFPSNKAFYYNDGSKLTVQFDSVQKLNASSSILTFQIILYANGDIKLQYLTLSNTEVNSSTVGIQNGTGTIGLNIVYNAAYLKNNLAILISKTPNFLTLSQTSGTIPSGEQQTIDVKFNAKGLQPDNYQSIISITSNDPLNNNKSIPVYLTVTKGPDLVSDNMNVIPKEFALRQNYPNPFNPSTTIEYDLPKSAHVTLSVYNILGSLVTKIVDEQKPAGSYSVKWNGQTKSGTAASGIYFTVIRAGDFRKTVKMILMK